MVLLYNPVNKAYKRAFVKKDFQKLKIWRNVGYVYIHWKKSTPEISEQFFMEFFVQRPVILRKLVKSVKTNRSVLNLNDKKNTSSHLSDYVENNNF